MNLATLEKDLQCVVLSLASITSARIHLLSVGYGWMHGSSLPSFALESNIVSAFRRAAVYDTNVDPFREYY
jgi:hypothetical protein